MNYSSEWCDLIEFGEQNLLSGAISVWNNSTKSHHRAQYKRRHQINMIAAFPDQYEINHYFIIIYPCASQSLTHSHSIGQPQLGPSTDSPVPSIFHARPQFHCALQSCIFPQGVQQIVLLSSLPLRPTSLNL